MIGWGGADRRRNSYRSGYMLPSSCYQQLSDLSGTEFTAGQLSDLEQAACDLIDSLPQVYQDSFAVLDYGFYLHKFGF